jgi:universal stress protein E
MQFLAATDFSTRSNRALRQAGLLAQLLQDVRLHILHIVDDDQPEDLIRIEKREAARILEEQIASMPELQGVNARTMVETGDAFDAILRVARDVSADLIIMGSHRKQFLLDVFIGTTIERVARKGTFPVLMVNNEAQRRYSRIVAATDMSDTSANALKVAISLGLIGNTGATLLHAFLAPLKGKMYVGGADQNSMDRYVENERRLAKEELLQFLRANELQKHQWRYQLDHGTPMEILSGAVSEMTPDLLVMGSYRRPGINRTLLGSVTEEALRSLAVDILVVPPQSKQFA